VQETWSTTAQIGLERVKGIEPSYSAWKAAALPLSYTRIMHAYTKTRPMGKEPAFAKAPAQQPPLSCVLTSRQANGLPSRSSQSAGWWEMQDSNLRRRSQRIYSPPPLPLGTISRNHFDVRRLRLWSCPKGRNRERLMAIGFCPVNSPTSSKAALKRVACVPGDAIEPP
jgi:hypothetical protein